MTPLYHPRPQRWPRFSLRGFFVLVTLLGCWLGIQLKSIRDRHEFLAEYADSHAWTLAPPPGCLRYFGERGIDMLNLTVERQNYDPSIENESYPEVQRAHELFPEAKRITLAVKLSVK